ncbi:Helix-turn-helix domain-containing protein [Amycolatopsis xylanica]|uniref:Helix-turn-helix domain-containing protein n=1 Tax=Amycolatopsis xylanica TaxID=589385 RepID=A0A1H3Q3Y4_9PSEU|nr:helix-turn-helix domain-containing protein [Amycolatopsis xylanica]SDZ07891.1 Helix-turn-helix domain-containing protein [Amycolatopsis xylanica]
MVKERRPSTAAEAHALASGIRLRIIRLTLSEALTNKELADRLGKDPATTLHHVRKLVDTGFLEPQPPRRGARGAKEIPYLSTGLFRDLSNAGRSQVGEAMLEAYLAEIAELDIADVDQAAGVLLLGKAQQEELMRRMTELAEEFRERPPDEDAEPVAVYIATYPAK